VFLCEILCKYICWLIIKVILRNARCNNKDNALHVSDGLSAHHQEFKTVHTATGICQTDVCTVLNC